MRVTSKGQVTIPLAIRKALDLVPSSEVEFVQDGDRIVLRKRAPDATHGQALVERLRGRARTRMSTEEIMRLTRGDDA